jgi:hypothetical protein
MISLICVFSLTGRATNFFWERRVEMSREEVAHPLLLDEWD